LDSAEVAADADWTDRPLSVGSEVIVVPDKGEADIVLLWLFAHDHGPHWL
jgi:hypothetical protein